MKPTNFSQFSEENRYNRFSLPNPKCSLLRNIQVWNDLRCYSRLFWFLKFLILSSLKAEGNINGQKYQNDLELHSNSVHICFIII